MDDTARALSRIHATGRKFSKEVWLQTDVDSTWPGSREINESDVWQSGNSLTVSQADSVDRLLFMNHSTATTANYIV